MLSENANDVENTVIHNSDIEDNSDDKPTTEAFQLIEEPLDSEIKTIGDRTELTIYKLSKCSFATGEWVW